MSIASESIRVTVRNGEAFKMQGGGVEGGGGNAGRGSGGGGSLSSHNKYVA